MVGSAVDDFVAKIFEKGYLAGIMTAVIMVSMSINQQLIDVRGLHDQSHCSGNYSISY